MKKLNSSLIVLMFFVSIIANAQEISIVSVQLTPFNLTPEAMLSASIINNGTPTIAETTSKLYNSDNDRPKSS